MQLTSYSSHDDYVKAQRRTDKRKSDRPALRKSEVDKIVHWLTDWWNAEEMGFCVKGLCHGARYGHEVDWFSERFPLPYEVDVIGTDLFTKGHPKVYKWDFHDTNKKWIGKFDFVYSNSLDHAHDPKRALLTWIGQLTMPGRLFLQWNDRCINTSMGDCFGAHFHEYLNLVRSVGEIDDLIWQYRTTVTTVVKKKLPNRTRRQRLRDRRRKRRGGRGVDEEGGKV